MTLIQFAFVFFAWLALLAFIAIIEKQITDILSRIRGINNALLAIANEINDVNRWMLKFIEIMRDKGKADKELRDLYAELQNIKIKIKN